MRFAFFARFTVFSALLASLLGCTTSAPFSSSTSALRLSGEVHGGQQPVAGATIQLYAVGAGGDGSAATPLLLAPVLTDAYGNFGITSDFICPLPSTQVYLVASGGNPGLTTGTYNSALAMMAALGSCGSLSGSTRLIVNELTTVGSMAALYPFASSPAAIGSAGSDAAALNTAFTTAAAYTNVVAGAVPGPSLPAGYYASSTEITTLADILAACINSSGSTTSGSACGNLFLYAKPSGTAAPSDTITAVIDILKNPASNVSAIFSLVPSVGSPFQPTLAAAPPDWTLPILPVPLAPTFSVPAGSYIGTQTVSLSDPTPGASIYYTLDGSTPSTSSSPYSGPLSIASSTILKAFATEGGRTSSPVATASYAINPPIGSLTAVAGSNQTAKVGAAFTTPLQVQVLDKSANPLAGVVVTFTSPASAATFSSPSCTTGSSGVCSVTATANSSGGTYTVYASVSPTLSASFTLTNTGVHSFLVANLVDFAENVSACVDGATAGLPANAQCTLRDALDAARTVATSSAPATITFPQTTASTIFLSHGNMDLPSYTTVQGPTSGSGATLTNLLTINGSPFTIFTQAAGVTATSINNLILASGGGYTSAGSATNGLGGAIFMAGGLTVNSTTFSANTAAVSGGAISNNGGTLVVNNSTFVNNQAQQGYGGAIDNYANGIVAVSNSTFNGNSAGSDGGAIYSSGTASITSSTIVGNTSPYGGGIYNKGTTMSVTNSIVNGNTNQDCGGIYCASNWAYVVFSYAGTQVVDGNNITLAFTDTLGNSFSQTVAYGQYSSPASVASTFGPYFYYNTSGLDTTPITGQSFGNLLVISPENGATLNPFVITNPGRSFVATQMFYPFLLSGSNNVYGVTAAQINLGALANNGGPTQTMLPGTGSVALCAISPSTATGTDQRGQPRAVTFGNTTCQDAGAVQTSY